MQNITTIRTDATTFGGFDDGQQNPLKVNRGDEIPINIVKNPPNPLKVNRGDEIPMYIVKNPTNPLKVNRGDEIPINIVKNPPNPLKVNRGDEIPINIVKNPTNPLKVNRGDEFPINIVKSSLKYQPFTSRADVGLFRRVKLKDKFVDAWSSRGRSSASELRRAPTASEAQDVEESRNPIPR
ncbi:hypothetical protein FPQ18DRAFT_311427 [Pyronema domesticum]|nr:hypothetical protein FPQ18DRAFT_311427 [Pyronema domesticum]